MYGYIVLFHRMVKSLEKVGEGAFSDVFSCLSEQDTKLAIKVRVIKVRVLR